VGAGAPTAPPGYACEVIGSRSGSQERKGRTSLLPQTSLVSNSPYMNYSHEVCKQHAVFGYGGLNGISTVLVA